MGKIADIYKKNFPDIEGYSASGSLIPENLSVDGVGCIIENFNMKSFGISALFNKISSLS